MYHPRLKGTHYEMGFHYGKIIYKMGINMADVIKLTPTQYAFCAASLETYEKYAPSIMEEVRGLADGLRLKYEDYAYWLISLYCYESDHGCTIFVASNHDEILFGRNMDMFPEYRKNSESVLYMPQGKNIFLGHSTAMVAIEDGLNEKGLAAGLTFLLPKKCGIGLNGGFLVRLILEECSTVKEAIDLLQRIPISSSHNIVLADKSGEMAVVEITSENQRIRQHPNYLIATNHFIHDNMLKYNNSENNWYLTRDRYEAVEQILQTKSLDFKSSKDILRGFVCQYPKSLNFDTIWSTVYDLKTRYNEISEGNPKRIDYKYDNRLEWGIIKKIKEERKKDE